mgnify:CR=1 FL=1
MSNKTQDQQNHEQQEAQFDFGEAKDLTVGQVIRKNEEVEAGVLPEDNILDKYIKQHREEIEADKFETRQFKKEELQEAQAQEELTQEVPEITEESAPVIEEPETVSEETLSDSAETTSSDVILPPSGEENKDLESLVLEKQAPVEVADEKKEETPILSRSAQSEPESDSKKRKWVVTGSALAAALVLAGSYYVYRQVTRSNQAIQSSQSSSNNQETQTDLQEFNTLYDAFYTDANKTALKNSQFDKLDQLKTLLDKLEGSREHTLAKSKYDSLATQIKAIQDINAQFETPAITDGVLDTNAKIKADAKFTEIKVGDLVSYQGYIARVMGITNGTIRLSRFGTMYFDEAKIQMVESVNIPKFKNNDRVFVRDIPDEEKSEYGCFWDRGMDKYVGEIVTICTDTKRPDRVKIDGWHFNTYHLEPVRDYDII